MIGITSYKDLEYWERIHHKVQPSYNRRNYAQANRSGLSLGFMKMVNSFPTIDDNTQDNDSWYIILLGNIQNETRALRHVLDNYQYLNRRTKDVRFFIPGCWVNDNGIIASNATNHIDKFSFNVDGFLETVDWLENGNKEYQYSEDLEMVLLPFNKSHNNRTTYDFDHMLNYNLDKIFADGKNLVEFITRAVKVVEQNMDYEDTIKQMDGVTQRTYSEQSYNIFIAGSKDLSNERDGIRAVFSQLSNRYGIFFRTLTYEDFDRSFVKGGRQYDYNQYITDQAKTVIFILDGRVGGITLQEFRLAMDSYERSGHPEIYVYGCNCQLETTTNDIQEIIHVINDHNQYYNDYKDLQDLKQQVLTDFLKKFLYGTK